MITIGIILSLAKLILLCHNNNEIYTKVLIPVIIYLITCLIRTLEFSTVDTGYKNIPAIRTYRL